MQSSAQDRLLFPPVVYSMHVAFTLMVSITETAAAQMYMCGRWDKGQ